MKKAVVTGACGFIGKALTINLLNKGVEVYAIVTNPEKLSDLYFDSLHIHKTYFKDYFDLINILPNDIDVFYHLAWQGTFGEAFKDYKLQLDNAKYSCDAVMIAAKIKAKKFVLASTVNILESLNYILNNLLKPRYTNVYSTSKIVADMIGKTLAYNNNVEFNTGLISMVYGENNYSRMIPNIVISNLLYNRESNLISADTPYDLIYVDEVAEAFYYIGLQGKNMKTYYVGHRKISTFKEIFDKVKSIINPKGILNYGFYNQQNYIDYSLIDLESLFIDTAYKENDDFENNIKKTAQWIEKGGLFK